MALRGNKKQKYRQGETDCKQIGTFNIQSGTLLQAGNRLTLEDRKI